MGRALACGADWERLSLKNGGDAGRKASPRTARGEDGDVTLDAVDEKIIAALRQNGSISNRDLASSVDINEATVRTRLRRLEERQTLRVVAMRDFNAMGYDALAAVGVQVKGRSAADVGADLAKFRQVVTVNVTIGTYDLEIQVIARDLDDLNRILTHDIAHVEGVERLFPGLALKVLKYNPEWSPL